MIIDPLNIKHLLQNTDACGDQIVEILNEIFKIQTQIIEQFPTIFNNIVETTQSKLVIENLKELLLKHQTALFNIRELADLDTKIICFRTQLDQNLPYKHFIVQPDDQQGPTSDTL